MPPYCVHSYGETHMAKNWQLWSTTSERLPTSSKVSLEADPLSVNGWSDCGPRWHYLCSFGRDPEPQYTQLNQAQIPNAH